MKTAWQSDDGPARMGPSERERIEERFVRGFAGSVLAYPWFDKAAFIALRHWFFPASRLWAAARSADGDVQRFFDAVPMVPRLEMRDRLRDVLAHFEKARAAAFAIEAEWDRMFFGAADCEQSKREAAEDARLTLRHKYNATRRNFRFLVNSATPRARSAIATPEEVALIYGAADFATLPDFGDVAGDSVSKIEVSRRIASPTGEDYWLRFGSPSSRLGDVVYARVHDPAGVSNPATIIFGHGICVEFDHWRGLVDECHALARAGFRVIRPEAPWHGRRNLPGRFGGENIIASFPMGLLDAMSGAVAEWSVLARWARETSTGPLAFAGSSLGALTAQFAADRANGWPEQSKPDALLLLTHTGDFLDVVMNGALANLWMSPVEVLAKGWTEELARTYLRLLEPSARLSVPADRIVSVLGLRDVVLPFVGGRDLIGRWRVPQENIFVWDRGHFSVPMTLIRNGAPIGRFREIMMQIGAQT